MNALSPIRIATRASRLAMWQAQHVSELIKAAAPDRVVEIVPLSTIGDRDKTEALTQLGGAGGTGVFTREIQAALLDGRCDLAVHSLKDLPTESTERLTLAAVPSRGAIFDVLVLPTGKLAAVARSHSTFARGSKGEPDGASLQTDEDDFEDDPQATLEFLLSTLPPNARIGTGSPRRKAQLLNVRPDLQFQEARGNVETRLRKLDDGEFDALILAEAGLTRLELAGRISSQLQPPCFYPAVGQGALGIECRTHDSPLREILTLLIHRPTLHSVIAERTVLKALRAGCHAPLGVWARFEGEKLLLTAVVLSLDGIQRLEAENEAVVNSKGDAICLGEAVAETLLAEGAFDLMQPPTAL
ncbi:MAG: hydroxymethylbilane synthase [Planctomycetia bacterium]|nr:hydroxymethylbilane synthase [Planctomycetia bacterium]